jgi:hypothetical protein
VTLEPGENESEEISRAVGKFSKVDGAVKEDERIRGKVSRFSDGQK